MGTYARIGPGHQVTIRTAGWLEQRTGGILHNLTTDLRCWAASHGIHGSPNAQAGTQTDTARSDTQVDTAGRDAGPGRAVPVPKAGFDWPRAALAWCAERGYDVPEPDVITHIGSRLDTNLSILRARAGPGWPIVIVAIAVQTGRWRAPVVYAETCHDSGVWFDADSVDIFCPAGHGWTWRTGRELITADGDWSTISRVFGPSLDAPFSECPRCAGDRERRLADPCPCDGTAWIICPVCGNRCDIELAPI